MNPAFLLAVALVSTALLAVPSAHATSASCVWTSDNDTGKASLTCDVAGTSAGTACDDDVDPMLDDLCWGLVEVGRILVKAVAHRLADEGVCDASDDCELSPIPDASLRVEEHEDADENTSTSSVRADA